MSEAAVSFEPAMATWLRSLVARRSLRVDRAQLAHDLKADFAMQLFQRQGGCCAVSGLSFSLRRFNDVLVKHPFVPSLDRISSRGGYTADNVRLVCVAVNFGMGQWGEELYLTFARAAIERSQQAARLTAQAALAVNSMDDDEGKAIWSSQQEERIAAAEAIAATLSGEPLRRQRRRIASLRRNLALGPVGLRAAAVKAVRARQMGGYPATQGRRYRRRVGDRNG